MENKQKHNNNFNKQHHNNKPTHTLTPDTTWKSHDVKDLPPLYVFPLGGQGEVGKNCYCLEMGDEIWVVDAGIKFAQETVSIEGIIPSFEYLRKNEKRVKGLIITHGHEDHIGASPHILYQVKFPKMYAGRLAAALVDSKCRERGVNKPKVEIINNKSVINSKYFEISFFNVIHSTPDSYGIEFKTQQGTVVSSGDFKFDFNPTGTRADLHRMAKLGKENVTLLLSDSTNAETDKWSPSETLVAKNLDKVVHDAPGRVIITTFASNVYRVREILNIAQKYNRKIAVYGWSMDKVVTISKRIKYINVPDSQFIDEKEIKNYKNNELLIICTGGQGEQSAALSKMVDGRNSQVKLNKTDTIVFASNAIPGNFESVEKVTNKIIKQQATVVDNFNTPGVHTSGHAGKIEQMLMLSLIKPKYFLPIHGEHKMLVAHGRSAVETGVAKENIFIVPNGGRVKIENQIVTHAGSVEAEDIYVDDSNLIGQSNKVISDRTKMAKNGAVTITIGINSKENKIVIDPKFNAKGSFNMKTNGEFVKSLETKVKSNLLEYYKTTPKVSFSGIKDNIRISVEEFIFEGKKITPIVVPIILNIGIDYTKPENMHIKPREATPNNNGRPNNRPFHGNNNHNRNNFNKPQFHKK